MVLYSRACYASDKHNPYAIEIEREKLVFSSNLTLPLAEELEQHASEPATTFKPSMLPLHKPFG